MHNMLLADATKTNKKPLTSSSPNFLQRTCACGQHAVAGGECAECRKKQLGLQRQAADQAAPTSVPPIVHEVLRSPGQPLDPATRAFMEPRFGHDFSRVQLRTASPKSPQANLTINQRGDRYEQEADRIAARVMQPPEAAISYGRKGYDFSQVRVHTDARAAASARAVNAQAYTVGRDIMFGAGSYAPGTSVGRHLIAHELTHTIQQGGRRAVHRSPSTTEMVGDHTASHDESVATFGPVLRTPVPMLQKRDGAEESTTPQQAPSATPRAQTPAPAPTGTAQSCARALSQLVQAALLVLNNAIRQLDHYAEEQFLVEVIGGSAPADIDRIGAALEWNFNTRDSEYAHVILDRLRLMESQLRSRRRLTVRCAAPNDPSCALRSFSQQTAAYAQPYRVVLCLIRGTGNRDIDVLIHELVHAVVPPIGSRAEVTASNQSPIDRAYIHQRVYQDLTPDEALHNAESYSTLIRHLVDRRITRPQVPYSDTIRGCRQLDVVTSAVARAEQWNFSADRWIESANDLIQQQGSLDRSDEARISPYFSPVNQAQLQDLNRFYDQITDSFRVYVDVRCVGGGRQCSSSALGHTSSESVANAAVNTRARASNRAGGVNLCPSWFNESVENRIRSMYALYVLSVPGWRISHINRGDVYKYIDLAQDLNTHVLPAPPAQGVLPHIIADIEAELATPP